jgi:hypothetical protein
MKHIRSIGIELECGCNESLITQIRASNFAQNFRYHSDGSVSVRSDNMSRFDRYPMGWHSGAELLYWNFDYKAVLDFVEFCFKNGIRQNESCGNHIHIKFSNKIVGALTHKKFFENFISWYKAFPLFQSEQYQSRLENSFCKGFYSLDNALESLRRTDKGSYRYHAINFNSLGIHGTIEIRLLPYAENFKQFKKAFKAVITQIDKQISETRHDSIIDFEFIPKKTRVKRDNEIVIAKLIEPTSSSNELEIPTMRIL